MNPWSNGLHVRRRTLIIAALALVMTVSTASGMGIAQEVRQVPNPNAASATADTAAADDAGAFPITSVMLFGSGVGYFEHLATVEGNRSVTMHFREDEVNDLLKSLVMTDFDGGTIRTVRYPTRDPLSRVLSSYSIDLSSTQTVRSLLTQARGEPVTVTGARSMSGTIFGIEQRPDAEGISRDSLVLLSEGQIRSIPLADIGGIRFDNPILQEELEYALATIADSRQTDRKPVTLEFSGEGERDVAVGYIRETPVWKTSYRVVLSDDSATLQGWAITENTTDQDWRDVRLSFVAGQPLSFVMNLYDPVYNERPVIAPTTVAAIAPPAYRATQPMAEAPLAGLVQAAPSRARALSEAEDDYDSYTGGGAAASSPGSVASQSAGQAVAGVFRYTIRDTVTIPRHQSAMIPIVNAEVDLEAVSIYDSAVLAGHPLRGLVLTNDTGLHLMGGPVTVYDSGTYAGDTRFTDIVEGDTRQMSYAIDIDMLVDRRSTGEPEQITRLTVVDGVLISTRLNRRIHEYVVTNRADEERTLIVEHDKASGWELVEPTEVDSQTSTDYRIRRTVAAGATDTVQVIEERTVEQRFALRSMSADQVLVYVQERVISEELAESLSRLVELRRELSELISARRNLESQVNEIYRNQDRITRNMGSLDRDSDLYRRYVADLAEQEDELTALEASIADAAAAEQAKEAEIDDFIRNLNVQ